ncbi:hypothetical protein [Bradyrhizobium tunisiense]|uniref:hypothetical protein n=1 Tax=Bradyrhizobium tunisiense TaxID=3278709 RepID=UPI0035DDFC5E
MALARHQFTVQDRAGNVVPGAHVEVRSEVSGQPLAVLYTDRDGTIPAGNPVDADANGYVYFYVAGGYYKIRAYTSLSEHIDRYVGIGLMQGIDEVVETEREVTGAGTVVIAEDDDDVILIKKTVGEDTDVLLPNPETTIKKKFRIVDRKYDSATHRIRITSDGTAKTVMGATAAVIDSNGASLQLRALSDGSGWV